VRRENTNDLPVTLLEGNIETPARERLDDELGQGKIDRPLGAAGASCNLNAQTILVASESRDEVFLWPERIVNYWQREYGFIPTVFDRAENGIQESERLAGAHDPERSSMNRDVKRLRTCLV
jgi:hypothetical protein